MTRRRYPKYKDSGVEWLGEVPEHWEVKKIRYLARFIGGSTPATGESKYWDEGTTPWVSPKDMKSGRISDTQDHLTPEGVDQCTSGLVKAGCVLIVVRSGILKHSLPTAINDVPVTLNQDMRAFVLERGLYSEYLRWLIEGNQRQLLEVWGKSGATVESIETEYLASSRIPIPAQHEQAAISDFLDRETGKVDALVEKKRKLIELLKEKRSALITRTVTRGLPPNAAREFGLEPHTRFKDSGIDWLGEVPEGWEVKKLRFLCTIETGDKDTINAEDDGDYPFFVRSQTVERISTYTKNCEGVLTAGDGVGVGKVFHYVDGKFDFHQRVYLFSNFKGIFGKYFFPYLKEFFWRVAFDGGAKSTVDSLRRPMIASFPFVVPKKSEQTAIATYLDRETTKIDRLINKVESVIARLQEYRTALITAAVTGKIDVRGEAA